MATAISQLGRVEYLESDGSQAVTVPGSCDYLLVIWQHENGGGASDPEDMEIDGVPIPKILFQPDAGSQCSWYALVAPPTGAQTITWTDITFGHSIQVIYLSGVDPDNPILDTDTGGGNDYSHTLDSDPDGRVYVYAGARDGLGHHPGGNVDESTITHHADHAGSGIWHALAFANPTGATCDIGITCSGAASASFGSVSFLPIQSVDVVISTPITLSLSQPSFTLSAIKVDETALEDVIDHFWSLNEFSDERKDPIGGFDLEDNGSTLYAEGVIGNAALFGGEDQFLEYQGNSFYADEDASFCGHGWLDSKSVDKVFFSLWGAEKSFIIFYDQSLDRFVFKMSSDGSSETAIIANVFGSPSLDAFYYISCGYDSDNDVMYISVNAGGRDYIAHSGGFYFEPNAYLRLGAKNEGTPGYLDGRMNLWGTFSKILSDDDDEYLYDDGEGRPLVIIMDSATKLRAELKKTFLRTEVKAG